jgi:hypothetical protein
MDAPARDSCMWAAPCSAKQQGIWPDCECHDNGNDSTAKHVMLTVMNWQERSQGNIAFVRSIGQAFSGFPPRSPKIRHHSCGTHRKFPHPLANYSSRPASIRGRHPLKPADWQRHCDAVEHDRAAARRCAGASRGSGAERQCGDGHRPDLCEPDRATRAHGRSQAVRSLALSRSVGEPFGRLRTHAFGIVQAIAVSLLSVRFSASKLQRCCRRNTIANQNALRDFDQRQVHQRCYQEEREV